MIGGAVLLLASMVVMIAGGDDLPSRVVVAWAVAAIGLASMTTGMVRGAIRLPPAERPASWVWLAFVAVGIIGVLIGASGPLDWLHRYAPTDPRAQPGTVLAAEIFFGFPWAALLVVGGVMAIVALRARRRPKR